MVGAFTIIIFTGALTIAFFMLVKRRLHLRLSKVEEVLGLDLQEDETQIMMEVRRICNEQNRFNVAKLNLIQLIKSGNHVARKNKKGASASNNYYI